MNIFECFSYVYLGREVNMANDLAPELCRRERAALGTLKSVDEKKTKNVRWATRFTIALAVLLVKSLNDRYDGLLVILERLEHFDTQQDRMKKSWHQLEQLDDHRDDR
ncbi:unnamed protein product [Heligmosomoides polygyrus]|uniref:Transposase n=1 Tax=Heligmosomoides polygyrus TaxID=6339 RepID=A0A183F6T1_HELPZ|nr:unnamed protein product [Heligmosomoides polygyrus]